MYWTKAILSYTVCTHGNKNVQESAVYVHMTERLQYTLGSSNEAMLLHTAIEE